MNPEIENFLTPTQFIEIVNRRLKQGADEIRLVGEVASFKINQGKWVFFDLKDETSVVSCFIPLWSLRTEVEDGMKILVKGYPKVTPKGYFSFTVEDILPVGEGSIKQAFEKLKAKLKKEGLFDPAKKRPLKKDLTKIGVISSTQAAGYADFIKILGERWGGLDVKVAHTLVQGLGAADQIIRALDYFNAADDADAVEVIAVIRGGGSAEDLAVFNDEKLARAIAASKIPVITGIGHEVDESLADLVADVRASTPSNAAQLLTRDRRAELASVLSNISRIRTQILSRLQLVQPSSFIDSVRHFLLQSIDSARPSLSASDLRRHLLSRLDLTRSKISETLKLLSRLDPDQTLAQGYAIVTGAIKTGNVVKITTKTQLIDAEIKQIKERRH